MALKCILLWLSMALGAYAAPPELYRVMLFEGFSPETSSKLNLPPPTVVLSGRVEFGKPFDLKLIEGTTPYYEVKGTLTKTDQGLIHFKGDVHFKTCDSSLDNTLARLAHDFVPRQMAFSGIIFDYFLRVEPFELSPNSP